MPILAEDPNAAILPDFEADEYIQAHAQIINDVIDDRQAAQILANLWHIQNNTDKCRWADRIQEEAWAAEEARRQATEAENQHCQAQLAEQEAAISEEREKNKYKYVPICNADVPSSPVILPCQYAVWKMKSGDYCELFYLTNNSLEEASRSTFTADEDALVMLPTVDGLHKWIPAGSMWDPKAQIIKDENLTWEQFNEAAPRMIALMKENDWPDDRVDMHISFWSALQNHRWRHDFNAHKQWALLLYQAQQWRRWHLAVGSSNSWSLARINQELLDEAREDIFNQFRIQQLSSQVRTKFFKHVKVVLKGNGSEGLRPQLIRCAPFPSIAPYFRML
jgi:hypothetical protein